MINRQSSRSSLLDSDWFCSQLPTAHKFLTSSLDWSQGRPAVDRLRGLKRLYWRWLKWRALVRDYRDSWLAPSYSQEGEDLILRRIFNGQGTGFFVDVGAHHPQRFSNTYWFYQHGWRGINIDAAPGSMEKFKKARPKDINLEAAIANGNHTLTYYEFSEPTLNGFSKEISQARNQNGPYKITGERPVRTLTLAEILDQHLPRGQRIDFLTIDVEGLDLEVLESNDWTKYKPTLILVEDLTFKSFDKMDASPVVSFLRQHGYELYCKAVNTLIFRRQGRVLPYEREAKFE
jgi:FkbM family methyltransferase